jgi:hypothetical protein
MTDRDGAAEPLWFLFNFSQTPLPPLILPYQSFSVTYPVSTCSSCLVGMPAQPIKFDSAQLAHQSNITLPPPDDDGDPYD